MSNLLENNSVKYGRVRTIVNDDKSISINAEDAAKGFGWYQIKNGREYVKWQRMNAYIRELGYSITAGKDDYLPESLFYLLAMKANNDTAQDFRRWIAVDVLPQIRMKGVYASDDAEEYIEDFDDEDSVSIVSGSTSYSGSTAIASAGAGTADLEAASLTPELKAIFCLDKRTVDMSTRLGSLESNMTIDYGQQEELKNLVVKKVMEALGGKNTPAYRELGKKAFCTIWKDYKRVMNVNSYRNTPTSKYDYAVKMLNEWEPDSELKLMIKGANTAIN